MIRIAGIAGSALWMFAVACSVTARAENSRGEEFVGSTPGEGLVREFVGGLASNASCHCITWHIRLLGDASSGAAYDLVAQYRVPRQDNPNQSEDGPRIASRGRWEVLKSEQHGPGAVIYRLTAEKTRKSLSLIKIGGHLLHVLNPDGSLMIGNGGWSYTLNRADHSEKVVDPAVAATAPDMSYPISPLATNRAALFGVFEGRSPCHGIARELKIPQHAGCTKAKWRVTLYQDAATSIPTTYRIEGTFYRKAAREGTWRITQGTPTDARTIIYRLEAIPGEAPLLLLKGDNNILLFADQNGKPLVGNAEFSYTLNRREGPK